MTKADQRCCYLCSKSCRCICREGGIWIHERLHRDLSAVTDVRDELGALESKFNLIRSLAQSATIRDSKMRDPSGDLCALGFSKSPPSITENQFRTRGWGEFKSAVIERPPVDDAVMKDGFADFIPTGEFSLVGLQPGSTNSSLG